MCILNLVGAHSRPIYTSLAQTDVPRLLATTVLNGTVRRAGLMIPSLAISRYVCCRYCARLRRDGYQDDALSTDGKFDACWGMTAPAAAAFDHRHTPMAGAHRHWPISRLPAGLAASTIVRPPHPAAGSTELYMYGRPRENRRIKDTDD